MLLRPHHLYTIEIMQGGLNIMYETLKVSEHIEHCESTVLQLGVVIYNWCALTFKIYTLPDDVYMHCQVFQYP